MHQQLRRAAGFMWIRYCALIACCLIVGVCYGYLAHKNQWFPYGLRAALTPDADTTDTTTDNSNEGDLEKLLSLPYLSGWKAAPESSGVVVHDRSIAHPGLNLYSSGERPFVMLMDMAGQPLHTWAYDFSKVWPDREIGWDDPGYIRRFHLFDNGDLLAIFDPRDQRYNEQHVIIKLDSQSRELWSYSGGVHHDLQVLDDGSILLLTRQLNSVEGVRDGKEVLEDSITILSADGDPIKHVSVLKAIRDSNYASLLAHAPDMRDILHTNTVEMIDDRLASRSPLFKSGQVLVSVLNLNTIAVIDMDTQKVIWAMTGMWKWQHQPTVVDNGNMLLFDNVGHFGQSKVIEFDPITQEVLWLHGGSEANPFFSHNCGSNQRLPNGNTLITESTQGRAFELTPDSDIVWEFLNPRRTGESNKKIAVIPELVRLPADLDITWAAANQPASDAAKP